MIASAAESVVSVKCWIVSAGVVVWIAVYTVISIGLIIAAIVVSVVTCKLLTIQNTMTTVQLTLIFFLLYCQFLVFTKKFAQ